MLIRLFFWFLVFYFLFKFLFRFVLPLLITTRKVHSKMENMRQNMGEFEATSETRATNGQPGFEKTSAKPSPSKEDYIDFEEVK